MRSNTRKIGYGFLGGGSMTEPMVLYGYSFQNVFVCMQVVCSWDMQQIYFTFLTLDGLKVLPPLFDH